MAAIRQQDKGWRYSKAGDLAAIKEVYDRIEADAALGEAEEAAERTVDRAGGHSSSKGSSKYGSSNKYVSSPGGGSTGSGGSSGGSGGIGVSGSTGGGVYSGTKGGKWVPKGIGSAINTAAATDTSDASGASDASSVVHSNSGSSGSTSSTADSDAGARNVVKPEVPRRVWTKKGDLGGGYRGYGSVVDSISTGSSADQISDGV